MLMVLMALVDLGRMKAYAATRWLWLALSGGLCVAAPLGCDSGDGEKKDAVQETPVPEYGPPADAQDVTPFDDGADDVPQVLYGPPPDAVEEIPGADVPQEVYGVWVG